jgi:hypothetical protein
MLAEMETGSFKSFYDDWRVIGKHFRVQYTGNLDISRHYTVCNVMQPGVYRSYLEALRTDSSLNTDVLNSSPSDSFLFTIKNYASERGLSFRFFDKYHDGLPYQVTGPIGKGLITSTEGVHIAFAAGTGVLTFIDLVAQVARVALDKLPTTLMKSKKSPTKGIIQRNSSISQNSSPIDQTVSVFENFTLVLYLSFNSQSSAIGLDLCKSL